MTALTIALAFVAVLAAALAAVALVGWRRTARAAERDRAELHERLGALERQQRPTGQRGSTPVATEREFVITHLGEDEEGARLPATPVKVSLTGPAFADAVVRESVVHTASLVQGLRRALSPETRNRIRFEMKRELKRSRKARKEELRVALREYRARHRADVADPISDPISGEEVA